MHDWQESKRSIKATANCGNKIQHKKNGDGSHTILMLSQQSVSAKSTQQNTFASQSVPSNSATLRPSCAFNGRICMCRRRRSRLLWGCRPEASARTLRRALLQSNCNTSERARSQPRKHESAVSAPAHPRRRARTRSSHTRGHQRCVCRAPPAGAWACAQSRTGAHPTTRSTLHRRRRPRSLPARTPHALVLRQPQRHHSQRSQRAPVGACAGRH